MNRVSAIAACFTALAVVTASLEPAWPVPKDESRIGTEDSATGSDEPAHGNDEVENDLTMPADMLGIEDIPDIETVELSVETAKRALDAFEEVRDKYVGEGLENYNTLEEFVAETEAGKRLEADVQAHGFSDITEWNVAIMAVGFAYSAIIYDYEADLLQQIEEVRNDPDIDEELRTRLVAGLTALMPSENNRAVLQALLDDPIYREKLKLLQEEE